MYAVQAASDSLTALPVLAAERDLLVGIAPLVAGIVVVVGLILAVAYGIRIRARGDQRPSSPGEKGPNSPQEYETRHRVPDEVPQDGERRMPYEFHDYDSDSHPGEHERPPRKWDEGSSGGFGSGGPGHT
ncbi:hypothetical protein DB35_26420 [Streptomyces abyssalis]|uniref:Uncharacterized protein n=1 Tax=Streptomyces abyssalis TaxID=933944 RepID=A0A1E7JMD8_9ACTN|nr:DUF6479 family protein [Streptomyces abyssalis]OEU87076.1 hypothetical protein DB35_26420 [Streptomyces abyssalis]OEU89035.1 hypothetical protein AN215_14910 [Streptomyces abyssalis]OEV29745.1 hypothetical protein AN219_14795 [Streptomyces nanshensis]